LLPPHCPHACQCRDRNLPAQTQVQAAQRQWFANAGAGKCTWAKKNRWGKIGCGAVAATEVCHAGGTVGYV